MSLVIVETEKGPRVGCVVAEDAAARTVDVEIVAVVKRGTYARTDVTAFRGGGGKKGMTAKESKRADGAYRALDELADAYLAQGKRLESLESDVANLLEHVSSAADPAPSAETADANVDDGTGDG